MELTIQLPGPATPLQVAVYSLSETGDRPENQDFLAVQRCSGLLSAVLADGAGGHVAGAVASRLVVENLQAQLAATICHCKATQLQAMVGHTNEALLARQSSNPDWHDMHSTVCVAQFDLLRRQLSLAHVGDTRLYWFRGQGLHYRTKDHSMREWALAQGKADALPARNQLYTAMGEPMANLDCTIFDAQALQPGDWFLMASDGLWEHFTDDELGLFGAHMPHNPNFLKRLHHLAISRANGRADNLSSIAVFIQADQEAAVA